MLLLQDAVDWGCRQVYFGAWRSSWVKASTTKHLDLLIAELLIRKSRSYAPLVNSMNIGGLWIMLDQDVDAVAIKKAISPHCIVGIVAAREGVPIHPES
jgi:hypothetical protein